MRGLALVFYIYFLFFILAVISLVAGMMIQPYFAIFGLFNVAIMGFIVYSLDGAMQCEGLSTPLSEMFPYTKVEKSEK